MASGENRRIVKRIRKLLKDLGRNPGKGIGKPEQLRFQLSGCWFRRITNEHRLVYRVDNDPVIHFQNPEQEEEWMDKCRHQFTEEEVAELEKYRDKQKDKRLALRFVALLMLAKNDRIDKVAEVIGNSVRTVENWLSNMMKREFS